MADEYADNFAEEEDDGDIEVILENPDELEVQAVENLEQDNENDDETKTVVKPPKKRVTRPQMRLDVPKLVGPRGIGVIEAAFRDVKFKGKGHELEDLNKTMRILEHWAHRLYPKMKFDDLLDKIEDLGLKKNVMVHVTKIRLGMEDETTIAPEIVEDEPEEPDPFDQLVGTTHQSLPDPTPSLTEEQKARMLRNRLIAEEIRMKKMKDREEATTKALEENTPTPKTPEPVLHDLENNT